MAAFCLSSELRPPWYSKGLPKNHLHQIDQPTNRPTRLWRIFPSVSGALNLKNVGRKAGLKAVGYRGIASVAMVKEMRFCKFQFLRPRFLKIQIQGFQENKTKAKDFLRIDSKSKLENRNFQQNLKLNSSKGREDQHFLLWIFPNVC